MIIEKINNQNNINRHDIQDIKNIWVYIVFLMKYATSAIEKRKDKIAVLTNFKYNSFNKIEKEIQAVQKKLDAFSEKKDLSFSDYTELQKLQDKQNNYMIQAKNLQCEISSDWNMTMTTLTTSTSDDMQVAYRSINNMFINNPALRRL